MTVRAVKRDKSGRWRYVGRPNKGAFAKADDVKAYRRLQRSKSRRVNVPRTKRLQNTINTVAIKLDISLDDAAKEVAEYLDHRELAEEAGLLIPSFPGSP